MYLALQLRAAYTAERIREDVQKNRTTIFHLCLTHITAASYLLFTIVVISILDSSFSFKPFFFVFKIVRSNFSQSFGNN